MEGMNRGQIFAIIIVFFALLTDSLLLTLVGKRIYIDHL